jgi:hypothetical protein
MLGRDLLAVSLLRSMILPISDFRYEPFSGNQIPDGMIIVLRLTALENSVGHLAITLVHQVGSDIRTEFGEQRQGLMNVGLSAGGRDRPLASLGDVALWQSAEVFVQKVCG